MKKTIAILTLSLIVGVYSSSAQSNLYWDANGATAGIGGSGTFSSTTGTQWTSNTNGTSTGVSGTWTSANASAGTGNNAFFAGTAGTVTLSTSLAANQIQFNTSAYTISNNSTSANFYLRSRNGIFLGDGVNLILAPRPQTTVQGIGLEGVITNVPGTSGALITVSGATASATEAVRIVFDGAGSVATNKSEIYVPMRIATTGSGYASLRSFGGDANIYGNVDVITGARLVLQGGSNSTATRSVRVWGNLTTADTDLVINEAGDNGTVVLYGTNSIGGNVNLAFAKLGYGSKQAFGNSILNLADNTSLGQQGTIGTTEADRTLANNLSVQGNVTFGLGSFANFLSGNVNLNGSTRTITLGNSTTFSGQIQNGGLNMVASNKTVTFNGASTYSGGTTFATALGGSTNNVVVNNTTGSAFGSGAVSVGSGNVLSGAGSISGATTMQTGSLLRPGNSPGVLTFGSDLTLNTGVNMVWELWGNTAINSTTAYDQVVVGGNLLFAGSNGITLDFGTTVGGSLVSWSDSFWDSEQSWTVFDVAATTSGFNNLSILNSTFNDAAGASLASIRNGASFSISQMGNDVVVQYVPEPSTGAMLMFGLVGLVGMRALRRKV